MLSNFDAIVFVIVNDELLMFHALSDGFKVFKISYENKCKHMTKVNRRKLTTKTKLVNWSAVIVMSFQR